MKDEKTIAHYHLPGLFEFYELYRVFIPLFYEHREFFYDWCDIGSIYGAPADCLWGGGRVGFGENDPEEVLDFMGQYNIPVRYTFSNSLLQPEHLTDAKCNKLCEMLIRKNIPQSGVILYSDLLLTYLKEHYKGLTFISSTTKVLTEYSAFLQELNREEFQWIVADFRLNKQIVEQTLPQHLKDKIELLCNECCWFYCKDRKQCYEAVSRKSLGEESVEHICRAPDASRGYVFSKAMKNPAFIGIEDVQSIYLKKGFTNFKIEGRSLGSALILEFLLYYMTKPKYQLQVREEIYLDSMLDIF